MGRRRSTGQTREVAFPPDDLTVIIDELPDRCLNPNSGAHRRTKEPYVKLLRDAASMATHQQLLKLQDLGLLGRWVWGGPIHLDIQIWWSSDRKILDWTNAHASLKAAEDGIFDNLEANDRQVDTVRLRQNKLPRGEDGFLIYTIIAITREDDDAKP